LSEKRRNKKEGILIYKILRKQLYKKSLITALFIALAVLIIDQLTKFIILKSLQPGESLPIIKNIFHITFVCNKGIAFGIFSEGGFAFIWILFIAVITIIFIFTFYKKNFYKSKSTEVFLSLIIAGAIGNLIDRMRFGYVVDFLDFRIWPVFNIADAAITVGTLLLILQLLKHRLS